MSVLLYERVHHNLNTLKLTTMEALLDNALELAVKEGWSTLEALDYLLGQEVKSKEDRALEFRMRIGPFHWKAARDFDSASSRPSSPALVRESCLIAVRSPY